MRALVGLALLVGLVIHYRGAPPLAAVAFGILAGMSIEETVQRRARSRARPKTEDV